jgi:hypothetical protein
MPADISAYNQIVGKCLINTVIVQVKSAQNHFSGKATYQEFEASCV